MNPTSLATMLLAASASSLCAIERPVPAKQPQEKGANQVKEQPNAAILPAGPRQANNPDQALPMPEEQQVERAFLGVFGNPISDALATQLELADGIGLTLEFIAPRSPAKIAGLKRHDIITQLGGKDINTQNDLRNAVFAHQPQANIELKYISGGKAISKQIELGTAPKRRNNQQLPREQENPRLDNMPRKKGFVIPKGALPKEMLQNIPPEQRQQLEQLLQGKLNNLDFRNLNNLNLDQLEKHFKGQANQRGFNLNFNGLMQNGMKAEQKGRMKMVDPDGSVTLEQDGDNKSIELHDPEGKLLYKGPYNNDADKLKVPENLRDRAQKIDLKQRPRIKQLRGGLLDQQLQELLNGLGGFNQGALPGVAPAQPRAFQFPKGNQMKKFQLNLGNDGAAFNMSSKLTDPKTGIQYSTRKNKDGKEVEILDAKGELLFSGPYNSASDKEMIPEEYRPFLNKLDTSFKLKLKGLNPEQP